MTDEQPPETNKCAVCEVCPLRLPVREMRAEPAPSTHAAPGAALAVLLRNAAEDPRHAHVAEVRKCLLVRAAAMIEQQAWRIAELKAVCREGADALLAMNMPMSIEQCEIRNIALAQLRAAGDAQQTTSTL